MPMLVWSKIILYDVNKISQFQYAVGKAFKQVEAMFYLK